MRLLAEIPYGRLQQVLTLLEQARLEGRQVFLFGNGGSASTASHFACDLGKGTITRELPRFKVTALTDNLPTLTAYANDVGYDCIFAEPLTSLAKRGDLAVGFSGSGNSANVLRAMEVAQKNGLATVGFTGFQGGQLRERVELEINVPSPAMGQIEDVHLAITHALCEMLKIQHG
jgi:D-sedoheptulose 7-phosphate isomerase